MSKFSAAELAYLTGERRLGRLATADAHGMPHVVPVGWRYNPDTDTIDVGGRNFAASKKFRNVLANAHAAFVVDDLASTDPWRPRSVMVQGTAEAIDRDGEQLIRITPDKILSWGLDEA
jgi:PPOX class F420-dependent enzyme/OxyR family protein